MLRFHSVNLQNIIYYDKAELDLDYKGITFVVGQNDNSKIAGRKNGAGKTLLASSIAAVVQADPLGALKRTNKHSLFSRKDSSINWKFSLGEDNWSITKAKTGRGFNWTVEKNGDDLQPRTAPIAEAMVADIFPFTQEEFFTTVYLNARRLSTIQTGTPTTRHQYFTDLFRLHDFETVKSFFTGKLKDLGEAKAKRDAYLETLVPVSWAADFDIKKHRRNIKELTQLRGELKADIAALEQQVKDVELLETHSGSLKLAESWDEKEYDKLVALAEQWEDYEDYQASLAKYKKRLATFKKDTATAIAAVGEGPDLPKRIREHIKQVSKARGRYEADMEQYEKASKKLRHLASQLETVNDFIKKFSKLGKQRDVVDIRAELKECETRLKHLDNHSGAECEVCGSDLPKSKVKSLRKATEKRIAKLEKELKAARDYANLEELKLDREYLETEIEEYKKVKKPKAVKSNIDDLEDLMLIEPEKPKKVSKPKQSLDKIESKLQALKKARTAYDRTYHIKDRILAAQDIDKDVKKLLRKKKRKSDRVIRDLATAKVKEEAYEQDIDVYKDITDKISKIGKNLKDWPIFEALIKAYGNKGIKIFVMQNIAGKIMENMNKYSHLLFPEPMKFTCEVDINKFNITATRGDGTESDVRDLSGGESISFALLWMGAVLPLIPENRRSSMVILDEFEAGVDEVTRSMIIEDYLPQLNTVVDHIMFITPNSPRQIPNSRVVTCIKSGKTTTLEIS